MDSKRNQELGVDVSQKSNLLLAVSMLVAGLLVGGLICGVYFSRKSDQAENKGAEQAAEALKNSAAPGAPDISGIIIPDKIFNIWGIVEKIDGNTLTVNAFSLGEQKKYTVKIIDGTRVVKREILGSPSKPEEGKLPASHFKETEARLSDLRENDNVAVESAENIRYRTEFEAKNIFIQMVNQPTSSPPAPVVSN